MGGGVGGLQNVRAEAAGLGREQGQSILRGTERYGEGGTRSGEKGTVGLVPQSYGKASAGDIIPKY